MPTEGIDTEPVTDWFRTHAAGVQPPLAFELITGGHSNLTYRVTDAAGIRWVLRRPPLGHILESAHDMGREHRLMSSLADTAVPVPPIVGLCTDETVNGADFYVMEFVDGHVLRTRDEAAVVDPAARAGLCDELVDTLAAIHAVDLDEVGLADLGRREDYVARQLRTWSRQFHAMTSRELPLVDRVHDALAAKIPPQQDGVLVHGDFRIDNCLVTEDGHVAAVLDWEICTLGDPLADLSFLLAYWIDRDDPFSPLGHDATTADGFAGRDELVARYEAATGRDVSDIDYYFAFASWRLACILEGVHARYMGGAVPEVPDEVELFATSVVSLLERAADIVGVR